MVNIQLTIVVLSSCARRGGDFFCVTKGITRQRWGLQIGEGGGWTIGQLMILGMQVIA
jgi:hypothetical protein